MYSYNRRLEDSHYRFLGRVLGMPGIYGIWNLSGDKPLGYLASVMSNRMEHGEDWFRAECLNYSLGFHGVVDFKSRLVKDFIGLQDKGVVIYGDVYSWGDLELSIQHQAENTLSLYEKNGCDFLKRLNGSFVISLYDEEKNKLFIASDRYGSKNLFYIIDSSRLIYSSEIKAILAEPSINFRLNPEAVAEIFTFMYMLGNKTLFDGINLLPPASILTYDFKRRNIQVETYWDLEFHHDKEPQKLETCLKEFDSLMEKAVERRISGKNKIGLFLSGGVDSRLMAGFTQRVADKEGKELISFTFGTKGGRQEKIGRQVADRLGIDNKFYEIPADMVAKYAEEVVYKGDGQIPIRDATFISSLDKVKSECEYVMVGAGCDTFFGAHLPEGILRISSKDELAGYLFNKYMVRQIAAHMPAIFSVELPIYLKERVKENFTNTIKEIPFNSCDDIAHYWDIRQRARRYILPLPNYIEWYINVTDPFLDNEVIDFALNLPLELKFNKKFIYLACESIFPRLADIPLEHTGVSIRSATGRFQMLPKVRQFALAEAKRAIEKISFAKILFRPIDYRGYAYWLRTGSKKYVEDALLSVVNEKIFDQRRVRDVVEEHMSGKKNHDILICAILTIQLLSNRFS